MHTSIPAFTAGGTDTSAAIPRVPGQCGRMVLDNEARENLVGFFRVLLAVDAQRSRQ